MGKRCNHPSQVRYSEGIHFTLFYVKRAHCEVLVPAVRRRRQAGRGTACCPLCGGAALGTCGPARHGGADPLHRGRDSSLLSVPKSFL